MKAALILLVPTAGLRLLVIFWLDLAWVGLLIMSLVYLLSGYLAAVFFFQQCGVMHIREQTDPVGQKGAAAGIVLCLLSWTIFVLVVAFENRLTVIDGPSLIFIGPLDFLEALFLGKLGTHLKSHPRF